MRSSLGGAAFLRRELQLVIIQFEGSGEEPTRGNLMKASQGEASRANACRCQGNLCLKL